MTLHRTRTLVIALVALVLGLAPVAYAATFTVSSSAASGPGTLRQAISDANANPGLDQIVFTVSTVTADVNPSIVDAVIIDGTIAGGRVTIANTSCLDVFRFEPGSSGSTLTNVIVTQCRPITIEAGVSNITINAGDLLEGDVTIRGNDNTIGGTAAGAGNRITTLRITGERNQVLGNTVRDITADSAPATRIGSTAAPNRIRELILRSAAGSIVEGNEFSGAGGTTVPVAVRVSHGTGPSSGIRITGNTMRQYSTGISVRSAFEDIPSVTGVTILGNSIASTGIAIDLSANGPTPNDPAPDADTGANNLQNYPVLHSATVVGAQTVVHGTLTSAPLTTYTIELFSTLVTDRDAEILLASFDVTTNAAGQATFTRNVGPIAAAHTITSTATNRTTGDTSEVSPPVGSAAHDAAAIPTLSTWSLIALALALAAVMVMRLR